MYRRKFIETTGRGLAGLLGLSTLPAAKSSERPPLSRKCWKA